MRENFELFKKAKSAELEHEISDEAHWIRCENQNPHDSRAFSEQVEPAGSSVQRERLQASCWIQGSPK